MKHVFPILAALALQPCALAAQQAEMPRLSLEQRMVLRCSAAFAIVSHGQANGDEAARRYPELGEHGQEFFVRSLAQLMDELGLGREEVSALVGAEARSLRDSGGIDAVMPACLLALDAARP